MVGGRIDYTVGFKVDSNQLNGLKTQLQQVQMLARNALNGINPSGIVAGEKELQAAINSAQQLEVALNNAFNPKLGTLNISKFNQSLSGMDLNRVYQDMSKIGNVGTNAFRSMTSQVLSTNMQLKQSSQFLNNMATTLGNAVKWTASSAAIRAFTSSVGKAYRYVQDLDKSLNNIQIVTKQSSEDMERFAKQANKAAKELHASTVAYTDAALIYYQQGLSEQEVETRANVTMKVANVTGTSAEEASEYLTAVWNGYKVSAEESEVYIDKLAKVASATASDLEELSTGMSKVASAANLMGVDVDQLNAQLSTIISVTREAPETVGTSLKTIYARMGDIEAGLDGETTLGQYTEKMAELGFNVLDANGKIRDMGEVVEEIGGKWNTLTREQQLSLANTMAGQRQYSRLLSLFDNWDKYTYAIEQSRSAVGELQAQQDIYAESIAAQMNDLKAASEELYSTLLNPEGVNSLLGVAEGAISLFEDFVESIGGGGQLLLGLGLVATQIFKGQIASGLANVISNIVIAKSNLTEMKAIMEITGKMQAIKDLDPRIQQLVEMKKKMLDLGQSVSEAEHAITNENIQQLEALYKQQDAIKERKNLLNETYLMATGQKTDVANMSVEERGSYTGDLENTAKVYKDAEKTLSSISMKKAEPGWYTSMAQQEDIIKSARAQKGSITKKINSGNLDKTQIEELQKEYQKLEEKIKSANKEKEKLMKSSKDVVAQTRDTMGSLFSTGLIDGKQMKQAEAAIKDYQSAVKNLEPGSNSANLATKKLVQTLQSIIGPNHTAIKNALHEMGVDFDHLEKEADESAEAVKRSQDQIQRMAQLKAGIESVVGAFSALGQVAMSIQTLSNIGDIIKNEDLTNGEKLLQVVTNLGFALPMLVSSMASLGKIMKIDTAWTAGATAAKEAYATATVGASGALTVFKGALHAATAGVRAFFAAMGPIGWIVSAIALLVPAILLLKKAMGDNKTALEKATEAQENANKALKDATERATEATNAYDNLKSSLNAIEDSETVLQSMTKGTLEWKEAVLKLNQQVLNLLQTYPELSKYVTNKDGVLSISQEGIDYILNDQLKNAQDSQTVAAATQIASDKANQNTEFEKKIEEVQKGIAKEFTDGKLDYDHYYTTMVGGSSISKDIGDLINDSFLYEKVQKNGSISAKDIQERLFETKFYLEDEKMVEELSKYLSGNKDLDDTELENFAKALSVTTEDLKNYKEIINKINNESVDLYENYKDNNNKRRDIKNSQYQSATALDDDFQNYTQEQQNLINTIGASSDVYNDAYNKKVNKLDKELKDTTGDEEIYAKYLKNIAGFEDITAEDIVDNGSTFTITKEGQEPITYDNQWLKDVVGMKAGSEAATGTEAYDKILKQYEKASKGILEDSALDKLLSSGKVSNGKVDLSGLSLDEIINLKNDSESMWGKVSDKQKKTLAGLFGFENFKEMQDELEAQFKPEELAKSLVAKSNTALEEASKKQSVLDTLSSGEELSEEDETAIKILENEHEQLKSIVDLYGERGRYSHEYLATLREIKEEEEEEARKSLIFAQEQNLEQLTKAEEQLKKFYDENGELTVDLDDKEFQTKYQAVVDALDTLQDTEYKIKIAIQKDFDSDIKDAFGLSDEFNNLQEMLSEDLVVSMEEAQKLISQGYGEILTNATETADGQIRLNQAVANSYIDEKQRELDEDKNARILELTRQREIYVAQKEILKNKLNALNSALNAEDAAKAAQFLKDADDLDKQYKNKVIELNQELTDENVAADETANINKNLFDRLNSMQEDSVQYQVDANAQGSDKEKEIIDKRVENAKVLYNAWKIVGDKIKNPLSNIPWNPGNTSKSPGGKIDSAKETDAGDSYTLTEITEQSLKDLGLADESGGLNADYKATISASIKATEAELSSVENNIGAIDAAIASMRTSSSSLNKAQANAGKGSKNKKELLEDELDIYHDVNREIEKLSTNLEALEKIQNRLTGKKLIQNLNEQIKLLKDQNKVYQDKLALQYAEAAKYKLSLSNKGVQFDSDGDITNYNSLLQKKQDEVNQLINSGASEEEIEKAKKAYEVLKKEMEKYEELLYNEIEETKKAMQELYDQVIEMQVEKFTMDIELQTNFADIKKEWLELRDSILYSEKAFGQSAKTAMSGLKDSMAGVYDTLADVEYMQGELAKIKAGQNSELFGNNEKIANETINETIEKTQEWVQNSLDYIEAIEEATISAMDEIITLQSEMIDSYDNLISALEHKMSLKELIGGDSADTTEELQETFNIQLGIAKTAKKNLDDNRKYLAENGEWLKENNPEEYLNYVNNVLEAEEQVFSSVEEAITTLNDLFDKGIENMLKEVETAYAGTLGWEELSTRWENDQELADLYLTSVQKEYELQKMLNKVNQDILDKQYDSIYAQQKLNDFKENYIKMLEKEGDLTQAQVDRMNKMYELTLLQIALEEAKNNKSSMKLTRDSQGNYVYQYTTDEAEVAKREQELADKKNEIYKQDIEDTKSAISDYISAGKDAQSEYMDLFESEEFKRYMELSAESVGKELTPEEQAKLDAAREKAYDMLAERAQTSAKQMEAQRKSTLEGINNILKDVELQEIDWTQDYDTIVDNLDENQLDALLDAGIDLKSSAFKSLFGFNSNTYLQDILSSENGVWNGYLNAVGSYGNNLEQVLQAVGSENLDSYYDNVDLIYQEVQKLQEEISRQSQQAADEFSVVEGLWEEAIAIKQRLEEDMKDGGRLDKIMDSQLGTLYDELIEIKKELGKQTELLNPNGGDTTPTPTPPAPAPTPPAPTPTSPQGNGSPDVGDTVTYVSGRYWSNASLSGSSGTRGLGKSATITKIAANGRVHIQANGGAYGWVDISQISGYDTGGYTGSWFNGSKDGRLAMLHQKELILNEKDTPKILDAVKLVREISAGSIIKDFEAQMRNTLSSLENQLIGTYANIEGMAAAAKQSTDQMLEQAVHIDASFPGVKDAREIEEALNNLVNVASQYAYENNK